MVFTLLGVFCAGVGLGQLARVPTWWDLGSPPRRSDPASLAIASLGLRAEVVAVGQDSDGSIATPPGDPTRTAGWYGSGPPPGGPGTAVIVGHVDTETEPAVFFRIRELKPGQRIEVTRRDRRVLTFAVAWVRRYPKAAFPAKLIFDDQPTPRLVLVTCGGQWVGDPVGYVDNVIVLATLA